MERLAMENSLKHSDIISLPEAFNGGGSQAVADPNTKKVRFKEGVGEEGMDMMIEYDSSPKISWKDKLLGDKSGSSGEGNIDPFRDESTDDLDFLEGDIRRSVVNGTPAIDFSERIQQILFKEMELTIVIKLLGRSIGYGALLNRISSLWNPSKPFHLMDIENGYYLAKFYSIHDYTKVLAQEPWLVYGQYLTVQPWTKEFSPSQPFPSIVLAWIRLPGLPGYLYKKKILEEIGGLIGKVVQLDLNTDNKTRGRFARMAVYINLDKPLTAQVLVNGKKQRVEYEALPVICFHCGKYGHTKELCPLVQTENTPENDQTNNVPTEAGKEGKEESFRPWMMVEKKSRSHLRKNNLPKKDIIGKGSSGSRFQALAHSGRKEEIESDRNQRNNKQVVNFQNLEGTGINEEQQNKSPRAMLKAINETQLEKNKQSSGPLVSQKSPIINDGAKRSHRFNEHNAVFEGPSSMFSKGEMNEPQVIKKVDPAQTNLDVINIEAGSPQSTDLVGRNLIAKVASATMDGPILLRPVADSSKVDSMQHINESVSFCDNITTLNTETWSSSPHPSFNVYNNKPFTVSSLLLVNNNTTQFLNTSRINPIFDVQDTSSVGGSLTSSEPVLTKEGMAEVQMLDAIGGPNNNRHTTVSFKEKASTESMNKNRASGKLMGGCASSKFFRAFREYNLEYKPDIVCLLEPRVSGQKAFSIIEKLGFDRSHRIESVGFSGGIWDLGYIGPTYTWQRGNTSERLDRALANDTWISTFPHALVYHLPRIKSDHRPIFLKTKPTFNASRGRPFRFLAGWTQHANFKDLVSTKWSYSGNMTASLADFTSHVKAWNRYTYGYIGTRKRQLLKSIGSIQKAMEHSSSSSLANLEMEARDELENVLNHEELLWRQKARCDWLQFRDRNTKFFHCRTMQRRKFNRILALRISNGEWRSEQNTLSDEAVKFFEDLYGENPNPMPDVPSDIFTSLKENDIDFLNKPVLNDEIKKALFDMAPLKAPRSDGFHALFFQSQWDLVGGDVCEWVQGIFDGKKIEEDLNNTLLVLIPKKNNPEDFSQFHPISLCSVLYKIVMKVIANRFKVVFLNYISAKQAGFIAGRNISDNIIIAQEVIHSMRNKQRGKNWMVIKLDLEKAYDRVSWKFIEVSLVAAGIPEKLRKVIMSSISSSTMQILWNGVPSRSFKPVRGIRQGCPLSPYLFVLCMEWLGYLIKSEMKTSKWQPIRLSRSEPALSHLFFADDLVIFSKAEMSQALLLKEILRPFCDFSGHKISSRKSNMFFSKGVDINLSDQISHLFGYQKVFTLGSYLGVLLLHDRITKSTLNFVIDKVRSKLQNWDARQLSLAGCITLAQSVLLAIPSYFMQSLAIPKGVCEEIEKIARQFIWGGSAGNLKLALIGWESICQPRTCGGLGLRHLQDHNNSFLMKIGFNLVSRKDALWVKVLRSKYGWRDQLPETIHKCQSSHLWKAISKVWPLLRENLMWSIGNGSTIRGWKDNWILDVGPLLSYVSAHDRINLDSTLKDWVMQDGSWNVNMLSIWLSEDMLKCIVSIPPPHPDGGEDRIIWARSGSGSFSIRSAYWTLKENSWNSKDDFWKSIWKYQGPQRVRTLEDIMHVLRDCSTAKDAWKLVVPQKKQSRCTPLEAELWGIFDGVFTLKNNGYKKIKIQSDNLEVVKVLSMEDMIDSGNTLIRRIKRLLHTEVQWDITHVPRECNLAADQMAKIRLSWQIPLRIYEVPPDIMVAAFLQEKVSNVS
ncbi:LINE-1 reverse transcriptase isogeny [Gossypium australe]|uniref:LINE-1 reverse transcriptase isogeny n=1 Tax=Gossypium australe TaxID=47621 RepID=A0A5B6VJ02_9ROSI|nr:LINE-1 reverse transcriptase isogeny [Gossypium australe]